MKNLSLSIRVSPELREKAVEISAGRGQKLTEFIRQAIEMSCTTTHDDVAQDIVQTDYSVVQDVVQDLTAQLSVKDEQLSTKDQQIERLQSALDQSQQLQALAEQRHENQRLKLEESQRPKPLIARLKAVFVVE